MYTPRLATSFVLLVLGACAQSDVPTGPEVSVHIAPLNLPGVGKVCFDLSVYNRPGGLAGGGETVWTRPGLCSDTYGNGGGGDISFVGPCDADGPGGQRMNSVTLWVAGLYDDGAPPVAILPDSAQGWQNPCNTTNGGCTLDVLCKSNADARVAFDLTILRQANQGFFDVAVDFDDIFCSAKVDCTAPLVFHPTTQARVPSVVVALACTDGDPGTSDATSTHLYMDDVALVCGSDRYTVESWRGPGNLYSTSSPPPVPFPWVQAMTFATVERTTSGGSDADVLSWSAALGVDQAFFAGLPAGTTCDLVTRATASHGPLAAGTTPAGASYPYIDVDVRVYDGGLVCSTHPLNGQGVHRGVATAYTGVRTDNSGFARVSFANQGVKAGSQLTTSRVAPASQCGNHVVDAGEQCDEATGNNPCGCQSDCTIPAAGTPCVGGTCGGPVFPLCLPPPAEPVCPPVEPPCRMWGPAPDCAPIDTNYTCYTCGTDSCQCAGGTCQPL